MTLSIGREALIPNQALKPFEPLVGEWRTTGNHPLVPHKTFHGRTSFGWQEGGAFLVMRSEIDEPEIPSGLAIFGSDDAAKTFFMLYFDERGVSRKYDVILGDNTITWRRDDPELSQRLSIAVEPDGKRLVSRGEMSRNGGGWEGDLSLTYERV
jgi:hypothetical protein